MARNPQPSRPAARSRFIAERYWPGLTLERLESGEAAVRRASAALTREGRPVRYLGSILIASEETAFSVFQADDAESVAEANRRAGLPFDRVVPVMELREPERDALVRASLAGSVVRGSQ